MAPIPHPRNSGLTASTPVPLYWAEYGRRGAPRLVFLHGGPGAHHDYLLPQLLALGDEYDLLFYDQRGGGRSKTEDRTPITWRTQADDLDAVLDELRVDPLTLVGYSWGGLLAMLYAIRAFHGETRHVPARMVLIDPAPVTREYRARFEEEFARRQNGSRVTELRAHLASSGLRDRDPDAYKQRAFELSIAGYFADPVAAHDLTPFRVIGRVQQSIWDSLGDFDLLAPGELDAVRCPTLIVHGRQDPIPLASSEAAARAMGAELVVLDGSGHVPYVEQPDALFAAVRGFLRRTAGSGSF